MYGLGSITGTARDVSTFYYDPLIDLNVRQKAGGHLGLSRELLGQKNAEARLLFNGAAEFLGWTNLEPLRESSIDFATGARTPFATTVGLSLAKEFDEKAIYAKIMAHAEDNYDLPISPPGTGCGGSCGRNGDGSATGCANRRWSRCSVRSSRGGASGKPTWDTSSREFTWGFHLNEPHPRGQYNGQMATAEACSPGAMARIIDAPNLRKFLEPTVYGVDFPTVCLSQAYYDLDRRCLVISMDAGVPRASGQATTFRVSNVDAQRCRVTVDGQPSQDWRVVGDELEITTTVAEHTFVISQQWG